jgi:hypothetical protein
MSSKSTAARRIQKRFGVPYQKALQIVNRHSAEAVRLKEHHPELSDSDRLTMAVAKFLIEQKKR